jgi:hypothetical protein
MLRRIGVCLAVVPLTAAAPTPASPWFGTWKLRVSDPTESPETLVYSDAGGGAMRMVSVEQNSVIVTRMDGVAAADVGKDGGGRTLAVRAITPTVYRWTFAIAGKPIAEGVNTLSVDGRMFEEVSWSPSKPGERITLIYERQ